LEVRLPNPLREFLGLIPGVKQGLTVCGGKKRRGASFKPEIKERGSYG